MERRDGVTEGGREGVEESGVEERSDPGGGRDGRREGRDGRMRGEAEGAIHRLGDITTWCFPVGKGQPPQC